MSLEISELSFEEAIVEIPRDPAHSYVNTSPGRWGVDFGAPLFWLDRS